MAWTRIGIFSQAHALDTSYIMRARHCTPLDMANPSGLNGCMICLYLAKKGEHLRRSVKIGHTPAPSCRELGSENLTENLLRSPSSAAPDRLCTFSVSVCVVFTPCCSSLPCRLLYWVSQYHVLRCIVCTFTVEAVWVPFKSFAIYFAPWCIVAVTTTHTSRLPCRPHQHYVVPRARRGRRLW